MVVSATCRRRVGLPVRVGVGGPVALLGVSDCGGEGSTVGPGGRVGGRVVGLDVTVDGATQDSRGVEPGQLFVALRGDRDGHEFVDGAAAAGAVAYLGERVVDTVEIPAVVTGDAGAALADVGRWARIGSPIGSWG